MVKLCQNPIVRRYLAFNYRQLAVIREMFRLKLMSTIDEPPLGME